MALIRYLKKMRFIDHLIRRKATGTQKQFAHRLGISVSTLNEYLSEMREIGFPIQYCHKRQCYFYEKEGKMVDSLFEESLSPEEMHAATGGYIPLADHTWMNKHTTLEFFFS